MIEIDPRWYFPASYVLNWRCPHCGEHVPVPNGALAQAHCTHCGEALTAGAHGSDRKAEPPRTGVARLGA
jgi:ribosomal protein S27E